MLGYLVNNKGKCTDAETAANADADAEEKVGKGEEKEKEKDAGRADQGAK